MRTVIIGAGEVGLNTARMLSHEGHSVVLVEKDERLVEKATEELDALVSAGNGANPKLLREAGIDRSDLLIAASSSDEVNIIACLTAKSQGVSRTVARIHNSDYYEAGDPFAEDTMEVGEVILAAGSEALGRALKEVRLPHNSLIVGVVRDGEALVPRGDTVLEERDHVLLISGRRQISDAVGVLATNTAPVREVTIYGGGRIGLRLALAVEKAGMSVRVIERDEIRARHVASQLRKGFVLHDEGISRDFMLQEGVDRTDAFVAVTGDDRANLLAAMYARQLGARLTIAGISRGEFAPLADALGVDLTISPRMLAAEAILRFVRRGEVVDVALLESGAEMI